MITFIDNRLTVETATQTAVFENGCLCSLISKLDGKTYLSCRPDAAPMSIVFVQDHVYPMDNGTIETRKLSDTQAEVIVHSWYGDGVIRIGVDEPTGDVLVRPSAYADRPGVKGLRYDIRGIAADLEAVLPVYQGVRLRQDDPLLVGQVFPWPNGWEAGFAIYEGADAAGFWLHCQDDRFNFKTLYCGEPDDPYRVGLACIAHGPLDDNTSAGSVTWRLNVFTGGWRVPAQRYKDWLWNAYGLEQQRRKRPDWLYDLKFAVSFSRADIGVLRALEKWVDPKKVLVHVSSWRTDGYDQNYPTYNANPAAQEMFRYGREKGFHIMPHTNSMQIDPGHPAYLLLQNQALRDLDTKKVVGWAYNHELWLKTDQPVDVPYSTYARVQPYNRKANIMPTIHCGCSMWHSVLREQIQHLSLIHI